MLLGLLKSKNESWCLDFKGTRGPNLLVKIYSAVIQSNAFCSIYVNSALLHLIFVCVGFFTRTEIRFPTFLPSTS